MANHKSVDKNKIMQEILQGTTSLGAAIAQSEQQKYMQNIQYLNQMQENYYSGLVQNYLPGQWITPRAQVEPEFETNLTTALVGWKAWRISGDRIYSHQKTTIWIPDQPLEARCDTHTSSPMMYCGCGIYAADQRETAKSYGTVMGQVYGWGRYVRGNQGWRAQFAYPRFFVLEQGQENLLDVLKLYHVPIRILQYVDVYSPAEDGYEHRNDQETWDSGTCPESDPDEDQESDDD